MILFSPAFTVDLIALVHYCDVCIQSAQEFSINLEYCIESWGFFTTYGTPPPFFFSSFQSDTIGDLSIFFFYLALFEVLTMAVMTSGGLAQ